MKTRFFRKTRYIRRTVQAACLLLFCGCIAAAVGPRPDVPVNVFLRLDPLVTALVPVAVREWIPTLWPGLIVLASALLLGRFFCGRVCPMGTTLDLVRAILLRLFSSRFRKKNTPHDPNQKNPHSPKYLLLAACAGAALLGVNLIHWFSPIALITRLYALLLHSLGLLFADHSLEWLRPSPAAVDVSTAGLAETDSALSSLLHAFGLQAAELEYLTIPVRDYATLSFVAVFFLLLFGLELVRPRFWCSRLCPAGALLSLCSRKPLRRRKVHTCIACGACGRACPTGAVRGKGELTVHAECITCNMCVDVCPVQGINFGCADSAGAPPRTPPGEIISPGPPRRQNGFAALPDCGCRDIPKPRIAPNPRTAGAGPVRMPLPGESEGVADTGPVRAASQAFPTRRHVLAAAGGGMLAAGLTAYLPRLLSASLAGAAAIPETGGCVRPPGALPEAEFLARCIRCGLCMKVCPSNGLQPVWFAAGPDGCFSPALVSRIGVCEPDCAACGEVCPTGALHALPVTEKQQAKIGTAEVLRHHCLAWAENRSCVVCEEVCPYGAINMIGSDSYNAGAGAGDDAETGASLAVPRPEVNASRCFGCGYCERFCPVSSPAVVVRPTGGLRLTTPSFSAAAKAAGLSLQPTAERDTQEYRPNESPAGDLPPGFTE